MKAATDNLLDLERDIDPIGDEDYDTENEDDTREITDGNDVGEPDPEDEDLDPTDYIDEEDEDYEPEEEEE
jgi:hypothetical protein